MEIEALGDVLISPSQGLRLLAIADLLKHAEIEIRGEETTDVENVLAALVDVAQEIALQVRV